MKLMAKSPDERHLEVEEDDMVKMLRESTAMIKEQQKQNAKARSLIRIPKDIMIYQISQKADKSIIENLMNQTLQPSDFAKSYDPTTARQTIRDLL